MIRLSRRQTIILTIALVALVMLTLLLAPSQGKLQQNGSTFSRAPQGYGAWYAFMQERGASIQRWQKPIGVLFEPTGEQAKEYQSADGKPIIPKSPMTLIQIADDLPPINANIDWVKQGNVLILLGIKSRVTDATFTSDLQGDTGKIRIETRRRHNAKGEAAKEGTTLLSDRFGAAVWQVESGKGRVIYASTPYLAANAYQDFRPNFEFLAKLATKPGLPIWVDEYIHGYRDPVTTTAKRDDNVWSYLLRTPLSLLAIQAIVLLLLLLWGQRRRLGPPVPLIEPVVDNSEAYIAAMASVLQKANCSEFVITTISKAEQLEIQKQLGLGAVLLPPNIVMEAWQNQTGHSTKDLQAVIQLSEKRVSSDVELQKWVDQVRQVRQQLTG